MVKLSSRDQRLFFSPIRKLAPLAEAAKKRGVKIYHLNIGQPDIESPEIFLKKIKEFNSKVVAYEQSDGSQALKQSLCRYYSKQKINLKPEELVVTTGGSEALMWLFLILFEPGQECLCFDPTYTNYLTFAELANVKLRAVPTVMADNFQLPSVKSLATKVNQKTRAVIITNPSNPTGAVYRRQTLKEIVDWAVAQDWFIIADETYREFIYNGCKAVSLLSFKKAAKNVVLVDSLSKRYSLCGARLGCLASKNKEVIEAANKIAQARLATATIEQFAASYLDQVPPSYFLQVRKRYQKRRDLLVKELNQILGVRTNRPDGAFYLIAELPVPDAEDFCRFMLEKFVAKKETVMLAPAESFYVNPGLGKNQVRIAYVLKREDLRRSCQLIRQGLTAFKRKLRL